jgi:hypothetical protein
MEGVAFGIVGLMISCAIFWFPISIIAIVVGSAGVVRDEHLGRKGVTVSKVILGIGFLMLAGYFLKIIIP